MSIPDTAYVIVDDMTKGGDNSLLTDKIYLNEDDAFEDIIKHYYA